MSWLDLLARFIAGGLLVVAVSLVGNTGHARVAGIVMLFPAVTLVSLCLAQPFDSETIGKIATGGLIAIPATCAFLGVVALSVEHIGPIWSIAGGIAVWCLVALVSAFLVGRLSI